MRTALIVVLTLAFGGSLAAAPKKSTLPAPATISCASDSVDASATWSPVTGATSYSVEFIAGYDTNADDLVDATLNYSYGTAPQGGNTGDQTFSTSLGDFEHDFGSGAIAPITLHVHVKALNPPVKGGAQSNPYSAFCDVPLAGLFCHDIGQANGATLVGCPSSAAKYCQDSPIDPTSSAQAKAACEACFGVGNCVAGAIGNAPSWRSGSTVYVYGTGQGDELSCNNFSYLAGDIAWSGCAPIGRWAP